MAGYLASGKSTFALQLSKMLQIPYFIKDTFKMALCEHIIVTDRAERSRFSVVTFDAMMYVAERMLETGFPIILEGNFMPAGIKKVDEAGTMKKLIEKYQYTSLTFQFVGDTQVLYQRFVEREKTLERGQVNKIGSPVSFEDFNGWCHNLDGFDIGGEVIKVETSDFRLVDFPGFIALAKAFMDKP